MRKILLLAGATVLALLFAGEARASGADPVCGTIESLANRKIDTSRPIVRGIVRSVVGDVLTIDMANGKTETVTVPRRDRGAIGQIVGSEVIVTYDYCYRILLAPAPTPKPGARVGTIPQIQGVTLQRRIEPLPPRPVVTPPPVPVAPATPIIIPQTW